MKTISLLTYISLCVLLVLKSATICNAGDIPERGAVYNYKTWECKHDGNKFELTTKHKITIYNAIGDDYNSISISENSSSKLKSVSIKVLDAESNVLYERDKGDLEKVCGFGNYAIYQDVCYYYATLESSSYPYSIEYEYTLKSNSLFFWRGVYLQHMIPVDHLSYMLITPTSQEFNYLVSGLDIEPVVDITKDGLLQYTWEADSIPPLEDIDYLPPGYNENAEIDFVADGFSFGGYSINTCNWNTMGTWYNMLTSEQYLLPEDDINYDTSASKHILAKLIYNDIIENIRYVAIEIGIGGWRPYPALSTQSKGYGDCKDMSNLLISRLRNAGMEAYNVRVKTRVSGLLKTDFPSFSFGHVIAVALIENDTIWMDPTCDVCPFGILPHADENIDVLVATNSGGEIWRTPRSSPEQNIISRETKLNLENDMNLSFTISLSAEGHYARFLRSRIPTLDRDETRQFVNRRFPGADKRFKIDSYSITGVEELDQPVTIEIQARTLKPVDKIGQVAYIDPYIFDKFSSYELEGLKDREFPLYLYYPNLEKSSISINWDTSLTIDSISLPSDDSISFPCGYARTYSSKTDSSVAIDFTKVYTDYMVLVDQFEEFVTYRKKLKMMIKKHVKFTISK